MPNRAPIRSRQHPQTALVRSLPRWAVCLGLAGSLLAAHPASWAADPKAAVTGGKTSPIKPPVTSPMTGDLMFQLMISEMELQRDEAGAAFERLMETARRYRHEEVYKRAVDVALAARAGDQALVAVKAWRQAWPRSRQPVELQTQILTAMGRVTEVVEPLRAMIELTPVAERSSVVASVPRLLGRDAERNAKAAPVLVEALEPWRKDANTRASAAVASGRIWLAVNEADKSFDLARAAQKAEPQAEGPALLALELMARKPEAEELVKAYLKAKPQPAAVIQLAYARRLTASQRFAEAVSQVQKVSAATPDLPDPYLLLGALQLELADPKAAEVALTRYLDLRQNSRPASPAAAASAPGAERDEAADDEGDDDGESDADAEGSLAQELNQAYLMLAQAAEQQKQYDRAQGWLEKVAEGQGNVAVTQRRASLLARQGKQDEAMELLRRLPERSKDEMRNKALAQVQLLRDGKDWNGAYKILEIANERVDDDADLLYEQALLAERLARYDEMEGLLRRVISLKPDQQHAYNALGYSLADRGQRLPEARELIAKALAMSPGDPFITDSLGWVEFKLGRIDEALRLLREAYKSRPDAEIAAHLGEVLWAAGKQDEARQVWRNGRERDAGNDVLVETLARLKVNL